MRMVRSLGCFESHAPKLIDRCPISILLSTTEPISGSSRVVCGACGCWKKRWSRRSCAERRDSSYSTIWIVSAPSSLSPAPRRLGSVCRHPRARREPPPLAAAAGSAGAPSPAALAGACASCAAARAAVLSSPVAQAPAPAECGAFTEGTSSTSKTRLSPGCSVNWPLLSERGTMRLERFHASMVARSHVCIRTSACSISIEGDAAASIELAEAHPSSPAWRVRLSSIGRPSMAVAAASTRLGEQSRSRKQPATATMSEAVGTS